MTLDRRKVLIYLRPDISASERFADAKIEAHHRGDRGDMSRTALLAGLALGEVDSRLPSMLAALLAEDTKPETLRKMLAKKGFHPLMGARPMQRLIQDTIRKALADELLFGRLTEGGRLEVDLDDKDEVTLDIAPLSKKERAKGTEPSAPEEEVAAD